MSLAITESYSKKGPLWGLNPWPCVQESPALVIELFHAFVIWAGNPTSRYGQDKLATQTLRNEREEQLRGFKGNHKGLCSSLPVFSFADSGLRKLNIALASKLIQSCRGRCASYGASLHLLHLKTRQQVFCSF